MQKKCKAFVKAEIIPFPLDNTSEKLINDLNFWPIIYILLNKEKIYIGQTNDIIKRMENHKKGKSKDEFKEVLLIYSNLFNQSAIYDIESKLIKYVNADSKENNVTNQKVNQSDFKYFQKDMYNKIFYEIWQKLMEKKIVNDNTDIIENKTIFKYSPFTSFSKQQLEIIKKIIDAISITVSRNYSIKEKIIENLEKNNNVYDMEEINNNILTLLKYSKRELQDKETVNIIKGGPGTGKTLLAIKIIYELKKVYKINGRIGFCVPQNSNYEESKRLLKSLKLLEKNLEIKVIKPVEIHKNKFDVLIIDEAHRLRHRYPKIANVSSHMKEKSELYQAVENSKHLILMYDFNQSVRPSDVHFKNEIEKLKKIFKNKSWKKPMILDIQFRVQSETNFLSFIKKLLQLEEGEIGLFNDNKYDIQIFNSIEEMHNKIKEKDKKVGLSRMVSGYYVKWISKTNKELFDFEKEGYKIRWNTKYENWLNSCESINEVGCIHTIQGHDLNYVGVIIGDDLKYNPETKKIYVDKKNFYDRIATPIKGSENEEEELLKYVKNAYYVLLTRGIKGLYLYVKNPDLKKYIIEKIKS